MADGHDPTLAWKYSAEAQHARLVLGVSVYLKLEPPRKGEFRWIVFERASERVVAEGYERTLLGAQAEGDTRRMKEYYTWREGRY